MVPLLILALALIVGGVLLARWFVQADPKQVARFIRWLGIALGVLLFLLIAVTGRWSWLPGLFFFALPWLLRGRALANMAKNMRGPTPGQSSQVETPFLRMTLNHDTGEMDGEVLAGAYEGRMLSGMALSELLGLWQVCASDEQSRAVLESYLDRTHEEWREQAAASAPGRDGPMSPDEARGILGVGPEASENEIEQAYRRLMLKMHPDQGGSDYLAAKINQAKEVLLGR